MAEDSEFVSQRGMRVYPIGTSATLQHTSRPFRVGPVRQLTPIHQRFRASLTPYTVSLRYERTPIHGQHATVERLVLIAKAL